MKKRTWHYVQNPRVYEISCDLCGRTNIEWSEYEGHVWCYDCQKDVRGTGGLFDGPIGMELCKCLGISFDRIEIETGKRLRMKISDGKMEWLKIRA